MAFNVKEHLLHIKTDYPYPARVIENTWIRMADNPSMEA